MSLRIIANTGFYAQDSDYFVADGVDNPPLRATADGVDGGNGVYTYGTSAFPAQIGNSSNYWVDVVYSPNVGPDTTAPLVLSMTPADGAVLVSHKQRMSLSASTNR